LKGYQNYKDPHGSEKFEGRGAGWDAGGGGSRGEGDKASSKIAYSNQNIQWKQLILKVA
jgi:hypothetical protein